MSLLRCKREYLPCATNRLASEMPAAKQISQADSISFAGALSSTMFVSRTHAYLDFRSDSGVITTIRDARYKLIEFDPSTRELYDLKADPYETKNLLSTSDAAAYATVVETLIAKRSALQAGTAPSSKSLYLPLAQLGG
jgi:arylsulfatase A-like enzyme